MALSIYSKAGAWLSDVDRVLSCDTQVTLEGVKTISFETILTDDLLNNVTSTDCYINYNEEIYDIASMARSLSKGIYKVKFSGEHASYRLNNYSKESFSCTGTPKEILTKLLEGTEFIIGTCDGTTISTFEVEEESTLRSMVLNLADSLDMDISFDYFTVSILNHKGTTTPIELIDSNVVSISKTIKSTKENPTYAITIFNNKNLTVGDELHLKFTKLGIDENVRLIGIKAKPYTSKQIELEVGESESTVESDLVKITTEAVNKDTSYYGVKITTKEGLTIERGDSNAKVVMNSNEFKMQAKNKLGKYVDKLYFDSETGEYKFRGSVQVDAGSININDNFVVDENGNVTMQGTSTIYGGKYYSGTPGSTDGFSKMTATGFDVYNTEGDLKLKLGYTTEDEDYPFLQLGSGQGTSKDFGLIKKFEDGLWIGNSIAADDQGTFTAKEGYNGIFFKFEDNTAYVVKDTNMKNIYTGQAIAKFG